MCTRFVLEQTRIRALLAALGLDADGTETTAPNALMAPIHHRMPALLVTPEACRAWLDPRANEAALAALLAPADSAAMSATPVSPRMNRAEFDSPECLAPAIHGLAARDTEEDGLGLL